MKYNRKDIEIYFEGRQELSATIDTLVNALAVSFDDCVWKVWFDDERGMCVARIAGERPNHMKDGDFVTKRKY